MHGPNFFPRGLELAFALGRSSLAGSDSDDSAGSDRSPVASSDPPPLNPSECEVDGVARNGDFT